MLCPICKDTALVMTERQSIEIDYCPQCRGVWLDRGELDKIIERSQQQEGGRFLLPPSSTQALQESVPVAQPGCAQPVYNQNQGRVEQQGNHGGGWRDGHQSGHQKHGGHQSQTGNHAQQSYRKKSFLQELFD